MTDTIHIKMIAFDMFGVIITEGHLIAKTLMGLLPNHLEKPQVKALYNQFNVGEISEAEFWQPLNINFDPSIANYSQGSFPKNSLRHQFLHSFKIDNDLEGVIKNLSGKYQLSILSNFPPDWADYLETKLQLGKHFEPRIFSGNVSCKKPDASIYKKLAQASNLALNEIAFIDDNLDNLKTAHNLGMVTVYFPNKGELAEYDGSVDFKINSLSELSGPFS
jgi:HAD superfamily hydrolase (TIGR01509 family)